MPTVPDLRAWFRRTFSWSNSGDAWRERLGSAALVVSALLWWRWLAAGDYAVGPAHIAVGTGLILAIALLARHGWLRLFGPVLFYELLRNARRKRQFLLRWLYAVGLLLLLLWVHWIWTLEYRSRPDAPKLDYQTQAKLAESFFYAFAVTQFVVVVALTPAYVAGAIAEEKERKTLEFLLATDLRNSEIVGGKLTARLGNLALFMFTGLPILSLMQFFGGIDPGLLLVSFIVTALTALSLAGLGILNSVLRRKARDAIVLTYLAAIGYIVIASLSLTLPWIVSAYRANLRILTPYVWEDTLDRAVQLFNYGNPIKALIDVVDTYTKGGVLADTLTLVVERYTLFHGLATAGFLAWAVLRIRAIALAQVGAPVRTKLKTLLARRRPPVGDRPMIWKEVRVEGGLRFGWVGRILVALLVGGSFVPVVISFYVIFFDYRNDFVYNLNKWNEFGVSVNVWLRCVNLLISILMLLGVAARAAGSVSGERDRDTLVSLMGTTLTTQEILWGKWWGSLLSVRLFVIWLGSAWLIGILSGGVNPLAVILQAMTLLTPAACLASIGLYYSAVCTTTLRATTWSLMTAVVAIGGHWVVTGLCCYLPLMIMLRGSDNDLLYAVYLQLGLTPPAVALWAPFHELDELKKWYGTGFPGFAVLGMFLWGVFAAIIGNVAHEQFRKLTHRDAWVPERGQTPGGVTQVAQSPPAQVN